MFISKEVERLIYSIENDDGWKEDDGYDFSNKEKDISIWTANGLFWINLTDNKIGIFNLLEKYLIVKAIQKRLKKNIYKKLVS